MRDLLNLLLTELKPYRRTVVWCTLLAVIAAGLDTLSPILLGRGFDLAKEAPLLWYGGAIVGWFVVRSVSERVRSYISYRGGVVSAYIAERYTRRQVVALLDKPLAFHYGQKSQESSDKVMKMQWEIDNLIHAVIFDLVPSLIALVTILGYVTWLEWRIGLVLTAAVTVYVVYSYWVTPRVIAVRKAWSNAERKISGTAWDALRNILVVKSTTNEKYVGALVAEKAAAAEPLMEIEKRTDRNTFDVQNFIISSGAFVAVAIAVTNLRAGTFTFGQVTAITAFAFSIFGYVRYGQWQARAYLKASVAYTQVQALAAVAPEDFASGRPVELRGAVEFRNIRFRYREDKATLEDVSFTVPAGSRVAIVGESGEGKTTLVDVLGRYYSPQSGTVLLDGIDSNQINLRSLRSQMAYVPQDLTLFHESIGFNIRYGRPEADDAAVREAARLAHLNEFIEALPEKFETVVGERGMKLSGGERQRVALARAFLRDPRILVLDEPTAHLDSKTEDYVRQSLDVLMKGRTTFVIAHRLRTVQDADLILVLKDGRIVESGKHETLATRPGGAYAALLRAQGGFLAPGELHLGEEGQKE